MSDHQAHTSQDPRHKVDDLLRDALAQTEPLSRKKLLAKAVYWNDREIRGSRRPRAPAGLAATRHGPPVGRAAERDSEMDC